MTQLPTSGMQTTIDHAAAASEAPVMISPRMIHTITFPTLAPSIVFLCRLGFTTAFYQHAHHHLRTLAQLTPQTNTLSFTSHNEKTARFSGQSDTKHDFLDPHGQLLLGF